MLFVNYVQVKPIIYSLAVKIFDIIIIMHTHRFLDTFFQILPF